MVRSVKFCNQSSPCPHSILTVVCMRHCRLYTENLLLLCCRCSCCLWLHSIVLVLVWAFPRPTDLYWVDTMPQRSAQRTGTGNTRDNSSDIHSGRRRGGSVQWTQVGMALAAAAAAYRILRSTRGAEHSTTCHIHNYHRYWNGFAHCGRTRH